ncbi:MAG TPA: FtsW/RodA/SpoVE family cell cycle protein [Fimbriimonadales bacterium]|nr:FtsW/RodA/SpoVE family cell cycle protein [Fimbriimonadales bacterium]
MLSWLVLIAILLGLFVVFDTSYIMLFKGGSWSSFAIVKHVLWVILSGVVYYFFTKLPPEILRGISKPLYFLGLVACILVFIPGVGIESGGAKRWFGVEPFRIQPSEFLKPLTIWFLAAMCLYKFPSYPKSVRHFGEWMDNRFVIFLRRNWHWLIVGISVLVIERQPDLGTAAMVGVIAIGIMIYSPIKGRVIALVLLFALLMGTVFTISEDYRGGRFRTWLHRWDASVVDGPGYQSAQSELAMAIGGVTGVGPPKGRAKRVLPAASTDFAFTTIAEEAGFIGSIIVISLLAAISLRLVLLASLSQDAFSRLVIGGTGWWIGIQSVLNLSMVGSLLPPIGVPLPFLSYGGSSLLALMMALGASQAMIHRRVYKEAPIETRRDRRRYRRARLSRA